MIQGEKKPDHTLLLVLVALFLFHSPFSGWWLGQGPPWYTVFVVWGVILVLVAINQWRISDRGD
ncbi:MAG: hypothetical protein KTR32_35965 [Granulosicoccus sp.]|nr:hypothetical protein [Granulosicoccus sp.]